ncbi:MAG: hypothetical protein JXA30_02305 [Deltaproteobacteria bacterium]|nr:hypothetical protein [Deltaproteobacteria bacterium]
MNTKNPAQKEVSSLPNGSEVEMEPSRVSDSEVVNPQSSVEPRAADRETARQAEQKSTGQTDRLSADDADRYAESFRPSWVSSNQEVIGQNSETEPVKSEIAAASTSKTIEIDPSCVKEDTDAEIKLAIASIHPVAKVRKKTFLWAGGAAAVFVLLIIFSVATQKKQETSLWENGTSELEKPKTKPRETKLQAKGRKNRAEPPNIATTRRGATARDSKAVSKAAELPTESKADSPLASLAAVQTKSEENLEAAPAAAPAAAAQPAKIRIQVTTIPTSAELTLDGSVVSNPFDQWLPKGGQHLFVARSNGYLKKFRRVVFDRNKELTLELSPKKEKSRSVGETASKTIRAKKATERTAKTSSARARAKSSRKGIISVNPY